MDDTINSNSTLAPYEEDEASTINWDEHMDEIIIFAVGVLIVVITLSSKRVRKALFSGVDNEESNEESSETNSEANISALGQSPPADPTKTLEELQDDLEMSKAEIPNLPTNLDNNTASSKTYISDETNDYGSNRNTPQQQQTFEVNNNNYYSNTTETTIQRQPQIPNQNRRPRKKTGGLFYRLIGRLPQSDPS